MTEDKDVLGEVGAPSAHTNQGDTVGEMLSSLGVLEVLCVNHKPGFYEIVGRCPKGAADMWLDLVSKVLLTEAREMLPGNIDICKHWHVVKCQVTIPSRIKGGPPIVDEPLQVRWHWRVRFTDAGAGLILGEANNLVDRMARAAMLAQGKVPMPPMAVAGVSVSRATSAGVNSRPSGVSSFQEDDNG